MCRAVGRQREEDSVVAQSDAELDCPLLPNAGGARSVLPASRRRAQPAASGGPWRPSPHLLAALPDALPHGEHPGFPVHVPPAQRAQLTASDASHHGQPHQRAPVGIGYPRLVEDASGRGGSRRPGSGFGADGGSACLIGLVAIHHHRTARFKAPLRMKWTCRMLEPPSGVHTCGPDAGRRCARQSCGARRRAVGRNAPGTAAAPRRTSRRRRRRARPPRWRR